MAFLTLHVFGQALIDDGKLEMLQEMYRTWPFFSVTMDMIEMVFAKVTTLLYSCLHFSTLLSFNVKPAAVLSILPSAFHLQKSPQSILAHL